MIYIYGDSHAAASFKNLKLNHKNYHRRAITMFRIGRDNIIINFNKDTIIYDNDIIVLSYGEVDCRCHIQRQINNGRNEDDVVNDLVNNYYRSIRMNIVNTNCKIIIVGVIPPTKHSDYGAGIVDEYSSVGNDGDRVRYTNNVNKKLEEYARPYNYIYFNPYSYYTREDGTLKHELSDSTVHLGDNSYFLEKFYEAYNSVV
jgi:hypothetical protein